jgi:hypothetical protein
MASVASGHFFECEDKLPRSLIVGKFSMAEGNVGASYSKSRFPGGG